MTEQIYVYNLEQYGPIEELSQDTLAKIVMALESNLTNLRTYSVNVSDTLEKVLSVIDILSDEKHFHIHGVTLYPSAKDELEYAYTLVEKLAYVRTNLHKYRLALEKGAMEGRR